MGKDEHVLSHMINIGRFWMFSVYYVVSELWGSVSGLGRRWWGGGVNDVVSSLIGAADLCKRMSEACFGVHHTRLPFSLESEETVRQGERQVPHTFAAPLT